MNKQQVLTNRIRVLRAEKKLSQEDLANAVGVSRQTIIAIEAEKYMPSSLLAAQIAKYFELSFEDIFKLVEREA